MVKYGLIDIIDWTENPNGYLLYSLTNSTIQFDKDKNLQHGDLEHGNRYVFG